MSEKIKKVDIWRTIELTFVVLGMFGLMILTTGIIIPLVLSSFMSEEMVEPIGIIIIPIGVIALSAFLLFTFTHENNKEKEDSEAECSSDSEEQSDTNLKLEKEAKSISESIEKLLSMNSSIEDENKVLLKEKIDEILAQISHYEEKDVYKKDITITLKSLINS